MINIKTTTPSITQNLDGSFNLTFKVKRATIEEIKLLKNDDLKLTICEWHDKRSLTQNAYMWVILDKISEKMHIARETLYRNYIKDYGKLELLPVKNEAVDYFIETWSKNSLGSFAEPIRKSSMDGYTVLKVYFGSSTYDTKEMTKLIAPIILDAEELGIQTIKLDDFIKLKNENEVKI